MKRKEKKKIHTNVHFDYGGGYSEEHEWTSTNSLHAIALKSSSLEDITYQVLVDKICRKIGIDETTSKPKLSYNLFETQRESYIVDDEDVFVYLTSMNREGLKPVLHVELLNSVSNNERTDQLSRAGLGSSFGVNYVEVVRNGSVEEEENMVPNGRVDEVENLVPNGRVDEVENVVPNGRVDEVENVVPNCRVDEVENVDNGGILSIFRGGGTTEEHNEPSIDDRTENVCNEDCDDVSREDFATVDNRLDVTLHNFVDIPGRVEEIENVEEWEDGTGLEINQEFCSRDSVRDLVLRAASKNYFAFYTVKSDKTRVMLRCREFSRGCKWYLRAAKPDGTVHWKIRIHQKMHTCSRADESTTCFKVRGVQRLVANYLHAEYPGQMDTPSATSLVKSVRTKLSVECSYSTALRGKKRHVSEMRGSPEKSYFLLYSYLHELKKVNDGTVTSVELDEEKRFRYLFIALGQSIEGFQAMRKVIVVDATFLSSKYGGMLIFAIAQDPNHHHYPIEFGVVDGENHASWTWFFTQLKNVISDVPELVFMSDRHQSIIHAVEVVYPRANHGHCIWHLSQNVRQKVSNDKDGAAEKFRDCAHAYTESRFRREYIDLCSRWPALETYLRDVKVEKWTRCYFKGDKYNIDTSNTAESMNSVFKKARGYPLLPMIDIILEKMSAWFNKYRQESASASDFKKVVPYVENILHERCKTAKSLAVIELNSYRLEYRVNGVNGNSYLVNLREKTCACRCFDIDKYPCVHAIAACRYFMRKEGRDEREERIQIYDLCSIYYLIETWALAYTRTIYLVPHESDWDIPQEIRVLYALPPVYEPTKGRNKEVRFPSVGESRRKKKNKSNDSINLERWLQPETSEGV